MGFSTDPEVYDEAHHWTRRVVRAALGTTTGLIALAILAKEPKNGPAFGHTCLIDEQSRVYTKVRRNNTWRTECVGTVESVRDNMRRLADHCKLSDKDRLEMFDELRKWIKRDLRARSEN